MRVAMEAAEGSAPDYFLWLNDDTTLDEHALETLLKVVSTTDGDVIVVAATRDPISLTQTYGGVVRSNRLKPVTFSLVPVSESVQTCDSMNGNCVLIPAGVYERVGPMNAKFHHAMGDLDYGLRARALGVRILVAPGTLGVCQRNVKPQVDQLTRGPWKRLKALQQPKELPFSDWMAFTRAHAGVCWPVYWLWPYAKALIGTRQRVGGTDGHVQTKTST